MALPVLQSLSRAYKAVMLTAATAMATPKRDATAGNLTAEVDIVTLFDNTGAAVGVGGNPLLVFDGGNYLNITAATTTLVKSGAGFLYAVSINTLVASATITLYDSLTASGTKIGTVTLPATVSSDMPYSIPYDLAFTTGLTIVTSAATDLTITYR
jgi:hypothetical protein